MPQRGKVEPACPGTVPWEGTAGGPSFSFAMHSRVPTGLSWDGVGGMAEDSSCPRFLDLQSWEGPRFMWSGSSTPPTKKLRPKSSKPIGESVGQN